MYLLLVYLIINTMGVPSCCGESTTDIHNVATIQHATVGRIETGWAYMQDSTGAYTFWSQLNKLQALLNSGVDTVHIIVGWHTPKWGSRAKWILDTLCKEPPGEVWPCHHWVDSFNTKVAYGYYPPMPDSMDNYLKCLANFADSVYDIVEGRAMVIWQLWYEMWDTWADDDPDPWGTDYKNTMENMWWFVDSFYLPSRRVVDSIANLRHVTAYYASPPLCGGAMDNSYAEMVDSATAITQYRYQNGHRTRFYYYYKDLFEVMKSRTIGDSISVGQIPIFDYIDIHLYPFRYAPYYVENGELKEKIHVRNITGSSRYDRKNFTEVDQFTLYGAINLVRHLRDSILGADVGQNLPLMMTEWGVKTHTPDSVNIYKIYAASYYQMDDTSYMFGALRRAYELLLPFDIAAMYFGMMEEFIDYLRSLGYKILSVWPINLKDGKYYNTALSGVFSLDNTNGYLMRSSDGTFAPKPQTYVPGLYEETRNISYLRTNNEVPMRYERSNYIKKGSTGYTFYFTHGRNNILDQEVQCAEDTVYLDTFTVYDYGTNANEVFVLSDSCHDTTYYPPRTVIKQNHHIYRAVTHESGDVEYTQEITSGDDDYPASVVMDNGAEEYLFYRHNKKELMYRIFYSNGSQTGGSLYTSSDSIGYIALFFNKDDSTIYIAFTDYADNTLRIGKFAGGRLEIVESIYIKYELPENPVFLRGDPRVNVDFVVYFNSGNKVYYDVHKKPSAFLGARELLLEDMDVVELNGKTYISTPLLLVLMNNGYLKGYRLSIRSDYNVEILDTVLINNSAGDVDVDVYGGRWYVIYERKSEDTLRFKVRFPHITSDPTDTMYNEEMWEQNFPRSDLFMTVLKYDRGSIVKTADSVRKIYGNSFRFCKTPIVYVDSVLKKLNIWYNYGGYGVYALKSEDLYLTPSVVIINQPLVIQYGNSFSITFKGYPGGSADSAGVAIEQYEVRLFNGNELIYADTLEVNDPVPTSHVVTIPPVQNDTVSEYHVEVIATSVSGYTAKTTSAPIYGRFVKMSKLPGDNRRWMVSSEDTLYIAIESAVRTHDLGTKMQVGGYSMVETFLSNMSEENPISGYYVHYVSPRKNGDPSIYTTYPAISHLTFGNTIEEEIDSFSETLIDTNFMNECTRLYKDTMFFVRKDGNVYYYCITTKNAEGKMPVDVKRMYLSSSEVPKKPAIITSNGKVYIAYETEGNTVKLDITDMGPRLLKSYTFSGRLPELTLVNSNNGDTVVLYYVEDNGIVARGTFVDTTLFTRNRIYGSSDSITWIGTHGNKVILTSIEQVDSAVKKSVVRYIEKNIHGVWDVRTIESITIGEAGVPYREFMMPWVHRVNDTLVVMTWLEEVTWDGNTEYGGWIRIYNPETGNIQSGIIGIKTGLYGIMPNPTRGMLSIRYGVSKRMRVKIEVYDISGRKVRVVENGIKKPGVYTAVWDGRHERGRMVVPGVYIINMKAGSFFKESKKVIIAR